MLPIRDSFFHDSYVLNVHQTPGDGSCLLHAIAHALYKPYRCGKRHGKTITKEDIVRKMRECIAKRCTEDIYSIIAKGNLKMLGDNDPYYSLQSICKRLRSNEYLGEDIIVLLEYLLSVEINVYDANTRMFRKRGNSLSFPTSIIIYYSPEHYEAVSYKGSTHFSVNHQMIRSIRS